MEVYKELYDSRSKTSSRPANNLEPSLRISYVINPVQVDASVDIAGPRAT